MRTEIIKDLKCSSCGSAFKVLYVAPHADSGDGDMNYGIASCGCGEFPIVDGILVTRKYEFLPQVIEIVKKARSKYALQKAIIPLLKQETFVSLLLKLSFMSERLFGRGFNLSFWKLITFLKDSRWATYLKYRFSCPSFISGMSLLPVFKKAASDGGMILDLGCGVGHLAFLISKYCGEEKVVCADKHFKNLYLARNYIVGPKASYICLDADEKIPFREKMFSAITSMDAFHYIEQKQMLADEFKRALKDNGVLFLIHLHNKNVPCIAKGLPLTPEGYAGLFPGFTCRMFPERHLVESVFHDSGIDLGREVPYDEVNRSDSISMVLTRNSGYLGKYDGYFTFRRTAKESGKKSQIILNPLYMKVGREYVRRFPSDFYEEEYYLIKEFFPEAVDAGIIPDGLLRKLIFIEVPVNYKKEGERLYRFRIWR